MYYMATNEQVCRFSDHTNSVTDLNATSGYILHFSLYLSSLAQTYRYQHS